MQGLHRFELDGSHYVIDPETCFCFECDDISRDVLAHYPGATQNHIIHLLRDRHEAREIQEVIGELEWLRTSGSILPQPDHNTYPQRFQSEKDLHRLTVSMPESNGAALIRSAAGLLTAASGNRKQLELVLLFRAAPPDPAAISQACREAFTAARIAEKELTVCLQLPPGKLPAKLRDHTVHIRACLVEKADTLAAAKQFFSLAGRGLSAFLKLDIPADGVTVQAMLVPETTAFLPAVKALDSTGFPVVMLDTDSIWIKRPDTNPEDMLAALRETAVYYAERLQKNQNFRLEPLAHLFLRIYNGEAQPRSDAAGTGELFIDNAGAIRPSPHFEGMAGFEAGSIEEGANENLLAPFDNTGAITTPDCMRCWARNLCGGGTAAVHQALSGSFRKPHPPWCDMQRAWLESAIAAFNLLSSRGVNFTRVYSRLDRREKPSFLTMAKAALRFSISMRPLEESDAERLTRWQNWDESAYFLFNESGILMATRYDREMDSLHPTGNSEELMLIHRDGTPMGLLKIRPEKTPGAAFVWIFMKNPADYAAEAVRRSFRHLLEEAGSRQALRRILTPVGPFDTGLADFLTSAGFEEAGCQREALYLHGAYHDVRIFARTLGSTHNGA